MASSRGPTRSRSAVQRPSALGHGLLVLLAVAAGALQACGAASPAPSLQVVEFAAAGTELGELPGAALLWPAGLVRTLNISMVAAVVQGPAKTSGAMIKFTTPVYRDDASGGGAFLFGPTLRVRAGDPVAITLLNRLPTAKLDTSFDGVGFEGPMHTNLHTHGLHEPPGVRSQASAARYGGGDNIFVTIPPGGRLDWHTRLPFDHLPGLHWYHPHKHGAVTIQAFSANGLILVEDDPKWLPDANGCKPLRAAMEAAPDIVMHFEHFPFAGPNPFNDPTTAKVYNNIGPYAAALDDANVQTASTLSDPDNPLCCGDQHPAITGSASDKEFVLVNGGWLPKQTMQAGQWQRWRLIHSGNKRFLDLQIVNPATNQLVPACQLMLLAKDGIYLQAMPRQVDRIFLTAAGRAELLVRCAAPGRYVLTAGRRPSPFGRGFSSLSWFVQKVVLTLEVKASTAPPSTDLGPGACTPLFPSYAADLTDASLVKANATALLQTTSVTFTESKKQLYSCMVNNVPFKFPDPAPFVMSIGGIVHWEMGGIIEHPVHVHTNPFQIVSLLPDYLAPGTTYSNWFQVGDWHDTLQMPMLAQPSIFLSSTVGLRFQPGPYAGYSVMHCHFVQHEDTGCLKIVKWQCGSGKDPQPEECAGFAFPVKGTYQPVARLAPDLALRGFNAQATQLPSTAATAKIYLYADGNGMAVSASLAPAPTPSKQRVVRAVTVTLSGHTVVVALSATQQPVVQLDGRVVAGGTRVQVAPGTTLTVLAGQGAVLATPQLSVGVNARAPGLETAVRLLQMPAPPASGAMVDTLKRSS